MKFLPSVRDGACIKRTIFTSPPHVQGFTLIELMITIMIFAIVTSYAVPSMTTFIQNNEISAKNNELISLLSYARTEAVSQSTAVSICGSTDATTCNSSNWENGGLIFKGVANAGLSPAADDVLKIIEPIGGNATLRRVGGADASFLRFDQSGRLFAADAGAFELCDERGVNYAKGISINSIGQVKKAVDTDENGIVEIVSGDTLVEVTCL